jgi:hypothetical protein
VGEGPCRSNRIVALILGSRAAPPAVQIETPDGVYSRPLKGYTADAEVKGEMVALILAQRPHRIMSGS